jgi:VIT1/CCC1 family predicted Fe2+/Mn2+ transporter
MVDSHTLSAASKDLILRLQQNEVTEQAVYQRLAARVQKQSDRDVLLSIAEDERRHVVFWSQYTQKMLRPQALKVLFFTALSLIFGYTFAIKVMEKGERNAQEIYLRLAAEIPEAQQIAKEEELHEEQIVSLLDEDRLQYVGSMVLGLNDALVELTGTLAGLTFALRSTKLVALSGLITGLSATLSMASSEYLSARSEGNPNALRAALYTGVMYIVAVACLVSPYLLLPRQGYVPALAGMLIIVLALITVFTYYISVVKEQAFRGKFLEMAAISMSVAALSFLIGYAVKVILRIDL